MAAVAAAVGADPLEHFAVVAAVLLVASLVFLRGLLRPHRAGRHRRAGAPVRWTVPLCSSA